jgi:hypothetical protein
MFGIEKPWRMRWKSSSGSDVRSMVSGNCVGATSSITGSVMLHRAELIELPPVRRVMPNPLANRRAPVRVTVDETPWQASLGDLGPLDGGDVDDFGKMRQVRRTPEEALFNSLLQQHHLRMRPAPAALSTSGLVVSMV